MKKIATAALALGILAAPASLAFANGGVVVTQAPETLFLRSSKGDDKADIRRVLFSGWGTQDTHAGPSNLRRGPDNWLWGTVGYSGFRGTVGGKEMRFGQGVFRMRPDGGFTGPGPSRRCHRRQGH